MSRLEANISLLIITFFASVQYVFLAGVPDSVSDFAFLCVTNFVGFVISLAFFFGELFRLDSRQVIQSVILAAELVAFNVLMLIGADDIPSTVTVAVLSSYFVFVAAFSAISTRKLPDGGTSAGVLSALAGVFLITGADVSSLLSVSVIYLVLAAAAIALYILTAGAYASSSNPSILAMGQMFFCFVFSLVLWAAEVFFGDGTFVLPASKRFWAAVIYISFFIRGLYTIIQIYAQRYVSPLNTSLIFSTEIIMTTAVSPLMSSLFGTPPESITPAKIAGSVLVVLGLLITDPNAREYINRLFPNRKGSSSTGRKRFFLGLLGGRLCTRIIVVTAAAYAVIDFLVLITGILPVHAGIKNFLPFTTGLFFGFSGVIGCCIGAVISFTCAGVGGQEILRECGYISLTGLGIWYAWHFFSGLKAINFQSLKRYAIYTAIVLVLSLLCMDVWVSCSYLFCGLLVSLPIDILFGNLLGIIPILPGGVKVKYDAVFSIDADPSSLSNANEILEVSGGIANTKMKQIFEIESCIEELSIRILGALPETKINVRIMFGYAVSVNMSYNGKKYNPFIINKGDDVLGIVSLKIIKHRALRASYYHRGGENSVHVVV